MEDWLTVEQAAAYIGKSLSTVRRAIPEAPAGAVRRSGGKVMFKRAYLQQRYNVTEAQERPTDTLTDLRQYIASLEQDNAAKTAIIAELTQTNAQLSKANAAILLAHNPRPDAGTQAAAPAFAPIAGNDWQTIAVAVLISLCAGVILWLVFA